MTTFLLGVMLGLLGGALASHVRPAPTVSIVLFAVGGALLLGLLVGRS